MSEFLENTPFPLETEFFNMCPTKFFDQGALGCLGARPGLILPDAPTLSVQSAAVYNNFDDLITESRDALETRLMEVRRSCYGAQGGVQRGVELWQNGRSGWASGLMRLADLPSSGGA